jgi:ribosomal protein S21
MGERREREQAVENDFFNSLLQVWTDTRPELLAGQCILVGTDNAQALRALKREIARRLVCDERRADAHTFAVFRAPRDRPTLKETAEVARQSERT